MLKGIYNLLSTNGRGVMEEWCFIKEKLITVGAKHSKDSILSFHITENVTKTSGCFCLFWRAAWNHDSWGNSYVATKVAPKFDL